jgi:hypothetical protein
MLVSALGPTLGYPIPYWIRLVGFVIGCMMLVVPLITPVTRYLRGICRNPGGRLPFRSRPINLRDAATELYEAMQGTEWARGMDRHSRDPNETLDAAAYYIIHRADVFVRKLPSRVPVLFDKSNLSTMAAMDGGKEIRNTKSNAVEFVDPSLRHSALRKIISDLRARQPH